MTDGSSIDFAGVADDLHLSREQVESVVVLLDAGNTVPFITRYRKERTGNLDEEQIRAIERKVTAQRQIAERADSAPQRSTTTGGSIARLTTPARTASSRSWAV